MAMNWSYDSPAGTKTNHFFKEDDIVKIMILDTNYPAQTTKLLNELNEQNAKIAAPALQPSFMLLGINFRCALVEDAEGNKLQWREPFYNCLFNINHFPPRHLFGVGYSFQELGGGNSGASKPDIVPLHPSTWESAIWSDSKEKISYSDVAWNAQNKERYAALYAKEQARIASWNAYIANYEEITEAEALSFLTEQFSRRFFICQQDEPGSWKYLNPLRGQTFYAKIVGRKNKQDGKTFYDVIPIDKKTKEIYSDCKCNPRTEEELALATQILNLLAPKEEENKGFEDDRF